MSKLRLIGVIGLSIVCLVLSFGYAFFQPFIPDAVYEAVPVQASFTYKAESLADLLASPICAQLDQALGAGNSIDSLLSSTDWVNWVAPAEIVVADLPLRFAGQPKAWAAVSWVGWRSPWLRWRLEHTRAEGVSFLGKHAVWPVWEYKTADIAQNTSLTLALTDNLLLICLSENPRDILLLLDTYDQRNPSINDTK